MTLPTGQLSASQINAELGRPATQQFGSNDGGMRSLAGVPAGQYTANALRGKAVPAPPPPTPTPGPTPPPPPPAPTNYVKNINAGQVYGSVVSDNAQQEYRGFSTQLRIGAIDSDAFFLGTQILDLYTETNPMGANVTVLRVTGAHAHYGFNQLNISGMTLYPLEANHHVQDGTTTWIWPVVYNWAVGTNTVVAIYGV